MKHKPTGLLTVYLDTGDRIKVGRLAARGRQVLFEYDPAFISSGLAISPFNLQLRAGVFQADAAVFDGMFGVFNDSLPDGWGRLLLDRAVERHGVNRGELTPLDRLAHVGQNGMGALIYEPDQSGDAPDTVTLQLDQLADEAAAVLAGEQGAIIEKLLKLNGASSGARPKVVAQVSADKKKVIHGVGALPEGYAHWMIKFPSANDASDIGQIEYAYSLMANDAGVMMPETYLFKSKRKKYFGIKRFDRDGDRRIHMHSLSGLINADHRTPSLDYDTLLKVTLMLTKDVREVERAFAMATFNVLAHNRDDHSKNVSFLLDSNGAWRLAPAYDLTFSFGPGGEQSMMVMGEGKAPGVKHLRALADKHGIRTANAIIARVQKTLSKWPAFAEQAGVTKKSVTIVERALAAIAKRDVPPPAKKAPASKARKPREPRKPSKPRKR